MKWVKDELGQYRLELAPGYVYKLYFWQSPNPTDEPSCWGLKGTAWVSAHLDAEAADPPPLQWADRLVRQHVRATALAAMADAEKRLAAARQALSEIT